MKKLFVLPVLAFAAVLVGCTRSASTPPTGTVINPQAATVKALIATQTAVAAVQTQQARPTSTPGSTQAPGTPTATPMVFVDPGMTAQDQEDAAWAVGIDLVRPRTWVPLTIGRDMPATRGHMAIEVGRMCLKDPIPEPLGYFMDIKPLAAPAGATEEQARQARFNRLVLAVSEALRREGLYLAAKGAAENDSNWDTTLSPDEWYEWVALAMTSPSCAGSKAQASEGTSSLSGKVSQQWGKNALVCWFDRDLSKVLALPLRGGYCNYPDGSPCDSGRCQPDNTCAQCTDRDQIPSGGECCECFDDGDGPREAMRCRPAPGNSGAWDVSNYDHPGCPLRQEDPPDTPVPATATWTTVPPTATSPPPTATRTLVPPTATSPPVPTSPSQPTSPPPDRRPTRTPRPVVYYTPVPGFCPDNDLTGDCGLTVIQFIRLSRGELDPYWIFPPNQLPPDQP